MVADNLIRIKDSLPQARSLNAQQRQQNVSDAFKCIDTALQGKMVVLIDDVCTSGATLEACAAALKSVGVLSVWGLTFAREI